MKRGISTAALVAVACLIGGQASAAGPEVVSGPGALPGCFKPYSSDTKFLQFRKKNPPYRIAMANGFVGNTWRIQMIKTLKAYAEQDDVKPLIKELKIVSTAT